MAADADVAASFAAECWVDQSEARTRFCVSDEHYVPTLLAHLGLEGECFCDGIITHTHWDGNYFHPKTYAAADVRSRDVCWLRHRLCMHARP